MELALPSIPVTVRPATAADLQFIDGLQKIHSHQVGWMPTKTLEGKIAAGHVLVAEDTGGTPVPLGYCIGTDRYFKREDVGIIYQMNVVPGRQRGFVGATLLKAMFERSAYGCRLYSCWCAQDIEANRFWEAMGFVPLAFRAGSERKARVHIFWQKRIRQGDATTPYWFPSQTGGGSIREDRLVLPIQPGVHWSEVTGAVLPREEPKAIAGGVAKKREAPAVRRRGVASIAMGGLRFGPPPVPAEATAAKAAKPKREKRKNDPKLVAAARELRDRWLERVNAPGGEAMALPRGKYDVSRAIEGRPAAELPRLAA